MYAIFFWQLVNKTDDCFNNIVFILVAKISFKKVCEKMGNNSMLEKALLVFNRNAELLRLVGAIFEEVSKVAFLRRMRKNNLINLKGLQKKVCHFLFYLFVVVDIWVVSENCNMLTERTYDSAVFTIFLNIITICIFIEQ